MKQSKYTYTNTFWEDFNSPISKCQRGYLRKPLIVGVFILFLPIDILFGIIFGITEGFSHVEKYWDKNNESIQGEDSKETTT